MTTNTILGFQINCQKSKVAAADISKLMADLLSSKKEFVFLLQEPNSNKGKVVVDSGCTLHMFNDKSLFVELYNAGRTCFVAIKSESKDEVEGSMKILLCDFKGKSKSFLFQDCLCVPSNSRNFVR